VAQDDYYYEIQLTNKQLVFYFMAGATGLILSFLAGIMVGRGVDTASGEVQASRPLQEERIVEETPSPAAPAADELGYAKRLEGERVDETLERPRASAPPARVADAGRSAGASGSAAATKAFAPGAPATRPPAAARPSPVSRPAAASTAAPTAATAPATGGTFTIQVGAFKDGASAESVVGRLKQKGFAAYVVAPAAPDGLFNVRVGSYRARAEADRVQVRLRDEEKFKPFIVTQ
jgi:cell division septation protein DedD